jgi:class 3 adenylate cyclase
MADEMEGLSSGAIDYITKPLWPPIVKARVKNLLDLRAAHRRITELNVQYSSYLSPELSESIQKGAIDEGFTSVRKKLTVFFSDIAGFTRLAENLDPIEMTSLLNEYFEAMNDVVAKHGGTLDKYIGDAILVFFGDPRSRGAASDAAACVSMALEMQETLASMRRKWKQRGMGESIQVRMGIGTGYATVGNYGSRHKREYTIIGPPVNLANRLESQAEVGSILISEETWQLVHDRFECIQMEPMQLKGISHPVRPYRVVGSGRHKWHEFEAGENWLRINTHLLRDEDKIELEAILRELIAELDRSRQREATDE